MQDNKNKICINTLFAKSKNPQRTLLLKKGTIDEKRLELIRYFNETFSLYETLFTLLKSDAAYYQVADPLRHPLIFYFAHTATFFINKLLAAGVMTERINPHFDQIFSVGVDEMSWDDLNIPNQTWPSVTSVCDYRNKVRTLVNRVIEKIEFTMPITWEQPVWILLMCIEHERIHLETSSVLIRQLPLEYVVVNDKFPACTVTGVPLTNTLLPIKGGKLILGRPFYSETYGWDNEYATTECEIKDFCVSQLLVSNQEFLLFIEAGGYTDKTWWTPEGWEWRQYTQAVLPRFWRQHQKNYFLRLLAQEIPMPWDWPVEVNYHESKAFCNFKGNQLHKNIRLLTEAEWLFLRNQIPDEYPDWKTVPGNIDLAYYASPCPVDYFKQGELYDVIGNVWQWTETPISPYPEFKPHPAYDDFSLPTFDDKHHLIKGGSWISTGNEVIKYSRYAFRRHFYQHAGLRYVAAEVPMENTHYYETDKLLSEYLEFHFGARYFGVEIYAKAIVDLALAFCQAKIEYHKALDLGCAVGRTAFELSKYFNIVYGVDYSVRFVNYANKLQTLGKLTYPTVLEGNLFINSNYSLASIGVTVEQAKKIRFMQGDATNLSKSLDNFDLVIAANLIDRLYDPIKFLNSIHLHIKSGGILIISSPYTWLQQHTQTSKWVGGIEKKGVKITTFDGLKQLLSPHFTLTTEPIDLPFVIRETARKFQHSIAEVTIWRRF